MKHRRALLGCLITSLASAYGSAQIPKEGDPVDLSAWAYSYRKDSPINPPETQWLWPHKTLRRDTIKGSMVWYYDDSADVLPKGAVLSGLLWEEPRAVQHVTVEFPDREGRVPKTGEVLIVARSAAAMWEDSARKPPYSAVVAEEQGHPTLTPQGTTIFQFNLVCDPLTKLYAIYTGGDSQIAIPTVHAFSKTRWARESAIAVEWGLEHGGDASGWNGQVEAYNGVVVGVDPLKPREGAKRAVRVRFFQTDDAANDRTLLVFRAGKEGFAVAVRELNDGPVMVPSAGVFIEKSGESISAAEFASRLAHQGLKTARERAETAPEESWESAMKRFHGNQAFPEFPTPPYEPAMKIDVPEPQLVRQWRLGAWHLQRWCQKQPDGSYAISIWPYTKSIGGNEGMVALGAETFMNIVALDMLGQHDMAEGGLNYWLFGAHAQPFLWDAEVMGGDALTNPYNSPNHQSPGYDQKHSLGHGRIMAAAAFHYRITQDNDWWQTAAPVLQRAGEATLRLRAAWDRTQPPGAWSHGLIPPGNISDNNNTRLFYGLSAYYYQGLRDVAALLADTNATAGTEEVRAAATFRSDIRSAVERSLAVTQVVKVGDGTYRRDFSYMPYIRGLGFDIDSGPVTRTNRYYDGKVGSLAVVQARVIDPDEPVVSELLDVYEDRLVHNGQNDQNGYNVAPEIYLARDDIPLFLRGLYNSYAAEIDPGTGYTFWESGNPGSGDASDKTFEEAAFLRNVRLMLVWEDGNSLWLAKGTPRAWLEQGKQIAVSHAPTFFGEVNYRITSDVANGRIGAVIDLPTRTPPEAVFLRLRHPAKAKLQSVLVNGQPWTDFDPAREIVVIKGLSGRVTVTARY